MNGGTSQHGDHGSEMATLTPSARGGLEPTYPGLERDNLEGPYYRPGAPAVTDLAKEDHHGEVLEFFGAVLNHHGDAVPGARVEMWQADEEGEYDNECGDDGTLDETEFAYRGVTTTDKEGKFRFWTVVPGNYVVDEGARKWTRVKHLHFKVYKQCHWPLTTQVFLLPDKYTGEDEYYRSDLAVTLQSSDGKGSAGLRAEFSFVLFSLEPTPRTGYTPHKRLQTGASAGAATKHEPARWGKVEYVAGRSRGVVRHGDVFIDVIAEGRGHPLVMLPSSGRDSLDYDQVAAGLAECGFRVLRPQPRGMLGSRGPLEGITLHDYASDVAAVIKHEGDDPAIVLGHAFGNWIARVVGTDYPELVRGIVLAAAAANDIPNYLFEISAKCADQTLSYAERIEYLLAGFFVRERDAVPWLTGWHLEARNAQRTARQATRREDWWAGGMAPILDLQAERDPWRPRETANELKDVLLDRVIVEVVADASHALLPEQPQAVVTHVADWVSGLIEH